MGQSKLWPDVESAAHEQRCLKACDQDGSHLCGGIPVQGT